MFLKFSSEDKKGFTLIEMMVAVSIFVIVAFIVTTTLMTMSAAYKRVQKTRLLLDNFNFVLQNLTLELREGKNFNCSGSSCQFEPVDTWLNATPYPVYCYNLAVRPITSDQSIFKCEFNSAIDCSSCDSSNGQDLVSPQIKITNLIFEEFSSAASPKKSVKIVVGGLATVKAGDTIDFLLQTLVEQRNE